MKDNKYIIPVLIVISVILVIIGSTFAYWNWQSTTAQKTNITFTTGANFSCSADGGGSITNTNYFVPTDCTNTTYAIKREITTNITNSGTNPVYMDMWLNINSIGSGLSNSENFKYALTTSGTNCTTGVVSEGNFNGKQANDKIELLSDVSSAGTYYIWVWLDAAETSTSTMNQSVSLSLGGECTNEAPNYTYTINLYDENVEGNNYVRIGSAIPSGITQYTTPGDAITAFETAYSNASNGTSHNLPFFLKHINGKIDSWCDVETTYGNQYSCFSSETECNQYLIDNDFTETDICNHIFVPNAVIESYVGFTISQDIASANPGMTAGTYYLKGGDNGRSYADNKATLLSVFGSDRCNEAPSSFTCNASTGFQASATLDVVYIVDYTGTGCHVYAEGDSICNIDTSGGSAS